MFAASLLALAEDDAVAAVALCVDLYREFEDDIEAQLALSEAYAGTTKPLALLSNLQSSIDPVTAASVRTAGVPVLEGTRTGLLALRHLLSGVTGRRRSPPHHMPRQTGRDADYSARAGSPRA